MKILLFIKSGAWRYAKRWTRCLSDVRVKIAFALIFILSVIVGGVCIEKVWLPLSCFLLCGMFYLYLLMKPDLYAKIKCDDKQTVYFAFFGTWYLYADGDWTEGRFIRYVPGRICETLNVLKVYRIHKTVLVQEKNGFRAYFPQEPEGVFIGSILNEFQGLFDDGKRVFVPNENGILALDYFGVRFLHCLMTYPMDLTGLSLINLLDDQTYTIETLEEKVKHWGNVTKSYLALEQGQGRFALYVVYSIHKCSVFVGRITGINMIEDYVDGYVYVLAAQSNDVYVLKK